MRFLPIVIFLFMRFLPIVLFCVHAFSPNCHILCACVFSPFSYFVFRPQTAYVLFQSYHTQFHDKRVKINARSTKERMPSASLTQNPSAKLKYRTFQQQYSKRFVISATAVTAHFEEIVFVIEVLHYSYEIIKV